MGTDLPQARPRVHHYLLLAAAVLGLGFNWPILARGVDLVPPYWLMSFRLWGGALIGFGMVALSRHRFSLARQDWKAVPVLGIFRLVAVFSFVFYALQILPPGRSGVLVWTGTLWTVPIAMVVLGERLSKMQIGGLVVGMGGLGLVLEPWTFSMSEPRLLWGYAMLLGAALSVAWTSVFMRAHTWKTPALVTTPWQMLMGAVPALAAALAINGPPDIEWTWETAAIVGYQMTLAGPMAVWGQLEAFRHFRAISVNLTFMATPVVGVLSSWWLTGEVLSFALWAGLALLSLGVVANVVSDRNLRSFRSGWT